MDRFSVPASPVPLGDCVPANVTAGQYHVCVVCGNGGAKCWGYGAQNRLGPWNADQQNWGDQPGEMGYALPYVDLAALVPSPSPTTASPSKSPTRRTHEQQGASSARAPGATAWAAASLLGAGVAVRL